MPASPRSIVARSSTHRAHSTIGGRKAFSSRLSAWLIGAGLLVVAQAPLDAGTLTASMAVTATVSAASCSSVSATAMSFGSFLPLASPSATSTLTVNCNAGTAYSISGDGSTPVCPTTSVSFQMSGATTPAPLYQLFNDAAHTQQLLHARSSNNQCSTIGTALTGTGTGAAQTLTIYGFANTAGNAPAAGSYTDTATITLSF